MNLRKGTQQHTVYNLLMPHQFMRTDKLLTLSKLDAAALSSTLTSLRRKGLAEYSGVPRQEGGLRWKKHPVDKPMFPAQEDVIKRRGVRNKPKVESYTDICERIGEDLRKLRWIISQQEKQLKLLEEVKAKLAGGV